MKKHFLIAILFFLLGAGLMYFLNKKGMTDNKVTTDNLLQSCLNATTALTTQGDSCLDAYQELNTCILSPNTCDIQKTKQKLQELEQLRKEARGVMDIENSKLDEIIKRIQK